MALQAVFSIKHSMWNWSAIYWQSRLQDWYTVFLAAYGAAIDGECLPHLYILYYQQVSRAMGATWGQRVLYDVDFRDDNFLFIKCDLRQPHSWCPGLAHRPAHLAHSTSHPWAYWACSPLKRLIVGWINKEASGDLGDKPHEAPKLFNYFQSPASPFKLWMFRESW